MPRGFRPYTARAGVALLLIVAAEASWIQVSRPAPWAAESNPPDWVASYQLRFDELKRSLPPRGVMCYVSDLDPRGNEGSAWYYAAQYSLAPLQLAPGPDCDVVIGNFAGSSPAALLAPSHGLEVVRDFGRGVMLLRRSKK